MYSLLVGAVVLAIWYGGFWPGVVSLVIGWSVGPFLLVASGSRAGLHTRDDLLRWSIPLGVALIVVWVSLVMRRGQQRAATAAVAAEVSSRRMQALEHLASMLSAAVTPAEVARALVSLTSALVGARGGAVGLVDGDEIIIVDPLGVVSHTHSPGERLPLAARAPIARAAAQGETIVIRSRLDFLTRFADGAARTPWAQSALAVPLRVSGEVVGSISLLFDMPAYQSFYPPSTQTQDPNRRKSGEQACHEGGTGAGGAKKRVCDKNETKMIHLRRRSRRTAGIRFPCQ